MPAAGLQLLITRAGPPPRAALLCGFALSGCRGSRGSQVALERRPDAEQERAEFMEQLAAANIDWAEVPLLGVEGGGGGGADDLESAARAGQQPPSLPPPPHLGPASCVSTVQLLHCRLVAAK